MGQYQVFNIHVRGVPYWCREKFFNDGRNFPKFGEKHKFTNLISSENSKQDKLRNNHTQTPQNQTSKTNNKAKIFESSQKKKKHFINRGTIIPMAADFSSETMGA